MKCPTCNREWDDKTEQAVCISMFGSCIVCRYCDHAPDMPTGQANNELTRITAEAKERGEG